MNTNLKTDRQEYILSEILRSGTKSIPELAQLLKVSEITIRRDLDELVKEGVIDRVRGGARRPSPKSPELPVMHRQGLQVAEKKAIGEASVSLIEDGNVIGILSGSTPQELVRQIIKRSWKNLFIVTNDLMILQELIRTPGVQTVMIGGTVYPNELATFGVLAGDLVKQIHLHKLFTGCRGIDPDSGISNDLNAEPEVTLVRAIAAVSDQVIVMADNTKIGNVYLIPTLPTKEIDILVTDNVVSPLVVEKFKKHGVQVIIAEVIEEEASGGS